MNCLRLALLGCIASTALMHPFDLREQNSTCQKTEVVVLGAGVAGITAAQALSNNSVTDFLIVEYNGEIGGRCRHAPFGKDKKGNAYTIELGANWIQGTVSSGGPANPIWQLLSTLPDPISFIYHYSPISQVQKYNVRNQFSNSWSLETFDSSGPANYTDKFLKFEDAYSRVEQDAGYILNESLPDRSFRDALRIAGWDPTGDPQAAVVEWLNTDYSDTQPPDVSSELFNIANFNSTFYGFSEANNMAIDSRGFNAFLHGQASEFLTKNDSRLLLNTIVTNILYSEDGVLITNSDGGCIAAEYAITTFSLGVLKSGDIKFTPALPNWKDTAIQAVNMGIYTKIFMQFPPDKVFWNTSTEFFLYASPTRGYYPIFLSLDHENFYPGSGLLIATVVTDQSNAIEKQDDETTKQQVLVVLRQIYGEDAVPEPLDFMYPRWGMTPWAHGSYSNWPPGLTLEGHQNLRANVGRVWFAGEHTSAEFNGYLQGAYFEGQVVGESVAACVNGSYANCPGGKHYEMLGEISKKEDFTPGNGWFRTSFQTIGDVDLPGGE